MILDAVRRANALPIPTIYEPWPFNDVPGTPLVSPILGKIDESPFVVADVTYLNLNVVYEVGFAIGRCKRTFLIRHKGTEGDKQTAKAVGIFDTLGYFEYESAEDLKNRLAAHIETTHIPFGTALDAKSAVYLIEPPNRGPEVGLMVSRIKKAGYGRYRSFIPEEDLRLSATDAVRKIAAASGIFIPMQATSVDGSNIHNIRCMFVAGLADGMGKPKLILAPQGYETPLDIRDSAKYWNVVSDITDIVADFCPRIVEYQAQIEPSGIDRTTLLQSLSIGDPRAENEMTTLSRYYLDIDEYGRALRGEVNLVVGRKGSGKTALFVRVRDRVRTDRRNVVVDLKPEGYQLIKIKEDILEYLSEGAQQHLITAFWEYLIYLEVAYKLLEKDHRTYRFNHELRDSYLELQSAYQAQDFSTEGDFSERLATLSQRLGEKYQAQYGKQDNRRLTTAQVTELVYTSARVSSAGNPIGD
jgi:acyl-CoA-binding protein